MFPLTCLRTLSFSSLKAFIVDTLQSLLLNPPFGSRPSPFPVVDIFSPVRVSYFSLSLHVLNFLCVSLEKWTF